MQPASPFISRRGVLGGLAGRVLASRTVADLVAGSGLAFAPRRADAARRAGRVGALRGVVIAHVGFEVSDLARSARLTTPCSLPSARGGCSKGPRGRLRDRSSRCGDRRARRGGAGLRPRGRARRGAGRSTPRTLRGWRAAGETTAAPGPRPQTTAADLHLDRLRGGVVAHPTLIRAILAAFPETREKGQLGICPYASGDHGFGCIGCNAARPRESMPHSEWVARQRPHGRGRRWRTCSSTTRPTGASGRGRADGRRHDGRRQAAGSRSGTRPRCRGATVSTWSSRVDRAPRVTGAAKHIAGGRLKKVVISVLRRRGDHRSRWASYRQVRRRARRGHLESPRDDGTRLAPTAKVVNDGDSGIKHGRRR